MAVATQRQQAHRLIDSMAPSQVAAVVALLETMIDPVSRSIAHAPFDDEPESAEEHQAVEASKVWFEQHSGEGIQHQDLMAEFGLTSESVAEKPQ